MRTNMDEFLSARSPRGYHHNIDDELSIFKMSMDE
jgi:hypothetical protein